MPFRYDQSEGTFAGPDGELIAIGYSGKKGWGRNNHLAEKDKGVGPIPCGEWLITGPEPHAHLAAPVWRLNPNGWDGLGRSGFLIHGNSVDGDASRGCIILPKAAREAIAGFSDRVLIVSE